MKSLLLAAAVGALVLAGCSPAPEAAAPAAPLPQRLSQRRPPPEADAPKPELPALQVTTVDGAHYDLAAERGHWVVVNFWATWCKPCLKEMPDLSALHAEAGDIRVVGLAYEEIEQDEMKAFLAKRPVSYPVAIVDVMAPPADFDTPRGLPMTYLISPQGRVAKRFLGPISSAEIRAAVADADPARKG